MRDTKHTSHRSVLPVIWVLSLLLLGFTAAYLLPIAWSLAVGDGMADEFATAMAVNFMVGSLGWAGTKRYKRDIRPREGFLVVGLVWVVLSASAAFALMLCLPKLSFTEAYFEAMSSFTTTGATALVLLDRLPESVNLFRHLSSWFGGFGIIGLAMAVLPLLGVGGMQIYKAEATGPIKDSKLTPRIAQTAKSLWLIYVTITVACMLSLKLAGMTWLDAICHALSTLSLAGVSTHDLSVGYFDSPVVEFIMMTFMLIAAINFATHFAVWREGSIRPYLRDTEAHWCLILLIGSCFMIATYIWIMGVYPDFWTALRFASFNVISIGAASGFVNADYALWPMFAPLWILLLSCVCSSAGSTGGGIKMIRTMILFKQSMREMRQLLHPSSIQTIKMGRDVVSERVVLAVLGFIHLYTISIVTLTLLLVMSGLDFLTSFSAIIATFNNAGPGLGSVGPAGNYSGLNDFQTWVCAISMLLGRLEVFVLIVPFTPAFWRE